MNIFKIQEKLPKQCIGLKTCSPCYVKLWLRVKHNKTYGMLSDEGCAVYHVVKADILKAYELVPQSYSKKQSEFQKCYICK